jgi:hypothetical protein
VNNQEDTIGVSPGIQKVFDLWKDEEGRLNWSMRGRDSEPGAREPDEFQIHPQASPELLSVQKDH